MSLFYSGLLLPPITSAYKRKYEDEEYDSEMDDFIDDSGEEQEEVSKHIKEIFGYDRSRYVLPDWDYKSFCCMVNTTKFKLKPPQIQGGE